jgi:hypothetical protein
LSYAQERDRARGELYGLAIGDALGRLLLADLADSLLAPRR